MKNRRSIVVLEKIGVFAAQQRPLRAEILHRPIHIAIVFGFFMRVRGQFDIMLEILEWMLQTVDVVLHLQDAQFMNGKKDVKQTAGHRQAAQFNEHHQVQFIAQSRYVNDVRYAARMFTVRIASHK